MGRSLRAVIIQIWRVCAQKWSERQKQKTKRGRQESAGRLSEAPSTGGCGAGVQITFAKRRELECKSMRPSFFCRAIHQAGGGGAASRQAGAHKPRPARLPDSGPQTRTARLRHVRRRILKSLSARIGRHFSHPN